MNPEQRTSPLVFIVPALLVAVLFFYLRDNTPPLRDQVSPHLAGFMEATEVELLSINPMPENIAPRKLRTAHGTQDGYPILGRVRISDPSELVAVRKAVWDIDRANKAWNGAIASCFSPRHCLRLNISGGTRHLMICYECSAVQIWEGQNCVDILPICTGEKPVATSEALNSLLSKHSIPLAK